MNARFLPPSARKDARAAARPLDDAIPPQEVPGSLACCCPARAMVQVVMPPTAAAAGTVVRALPDPGGEVAAWIGARLYAGG
jgi:hypothetical protein